MSYIPLQNITVTQNGNSLDAFSRLRVSEVTSLFDIKYLTDKQPLLIDEVVNATGAATFNASAVDLTTSANGDYVIRQSKQRFPYFNGKSQLIFFTMSNFQSQANITKRRGYFNSSIVAPYTANFDGLFLQNDGTNVSINVYNDGTVTETTNQSSWNLDTLNGSGASGVTIDWEKCQIIIIDFQYLGVGRVRWGVDIAGEVIYFHESNHANNAALENTYMRSPNHPIRTEIRQTGAGSGLLREICASVGSEGGTNILGTPKCANLGSTFVNADTVGTKYALIGMRLKSTELDGIIYATDASILSVTNDNLLVEVIVNPTVAGVFTYADETDSRVQIAQGAAAGTNTVTGGTVIHSQYITQGQGISFTLDNAFRLGATIAGVRDEIVIVATPLSSNMDVFCSLNRIELI